ncbi:hypothetical protein BC834DRAFT_412216 [Gloeopeniophorella convolvens]|nr:hypothetical protein BC834DRAFT_412216 [Gloeopeniophorella convolvens]
MAEGRMQLAMDETGERQGRDARAIAWLINNRTEESEMEDLVLSIPASFDTPWGVDTWRAVARRDASDEDEAPPLQIPNPDSSSPSGQVRTFMPDHRWNRLLSQPLPEIHPHSAVLELYKKIGRSLKTWSNSGSSGEKLRRARACIESIALLAVHTGASISRFEHPISIAVSLANVGAASEQAREMLPSAIGSTTPFEMHLTCTALLTCRGLDGAVGGNYLHSDLLAEVLERCQTLDRLLHSALQSMRSLYGALEDGLPNDDEEKLRVALRSHEIEIRELDDIRTEYHKLRGGPPQHFETLSWILSDFCSLLPGTLLNASTDPSPLIQTLATSFRDERHILRQLVPAEPILQTLVAFGPRLRAIIEDAGTASTSERAVELVKELQGIWGQLRANPGSPMNVTWERMEERRYWRIWDWSESSGFGSVVELFFITLQHVLENPGGTFTESRYIFYTLTFRALTSDWQRHKYSKATQRVLLDLLCDILIPGRGIVSHSFPQWVMVEFLALAKNILQGARGSHIDDVLRQPKVAALVAAISNESGPLYRLYWRYKARALLQELSALAEAPPDTCTLLH